MTNLTICDSEIVDYIMHMLIQSSNHIPAALGKEEEMRLEVVEKEQNRRLVTRQTEGPFKKWESIQEFEGRGGGNSSTHIRHSIDYELPTTGKIANMLSGSQADNKIRKGLEQAAQTVKQKLESGQA
jgi:ligand-binding SRPBCC domain-containing protein